MEAVDPVETQVIAISFVLGYSYLESPCPQSDHEQTEQQLQTHNCR